MSDDDDDPPPAVATPTLTLPIDPETFERLETLVQFVCPHDRRIYVSETYTRCPVCGCWWRFGLVKVGNDANDPTFRIAVEPMDAIH